MLQIAVLVLAFVGSVACLDTQVFASNFAACPVTQSTHGVENDALQALPPPDGKFTFRPGGPGFVDRDGALGIKFAWTRLKKGQLHVGGRRLDAEAGPARAYISDGYGDTGFQPIYLVFPTPGCWEIFGTIDDAKLTFVVFVEQIGDGPSWRFEGPGRGWRLTTGCSGPVTDKVPTSNCPRPAAEPGR